MQCTMGLLLLLVLAACQPPTLTSFNSAGGTVGYHIATDSRADVLDTAQRYCAGLGKKAELGATSMGMSSMEQAFICVAP
jgi:hypothetical protein